jgi:hypothetical protein
VSYHQHILDIPSARAELALQTLIAKYEEGAITTQDDLMNAIVEAYIGIIAESTDPTVKPISDEYGLNLYRDIITKPFAQISNDLDLAYRQLTRLNNSIVQLANLQTSERLGLAQTLKSVRTKVDAVRALSSDLTVVETFTSNANLDVAQTSASVNLATGVATLGITSTENLNDRIEAISVDYPDRNAKYLRGIPGNNLEIERTAQASSVIVSTAATLGEANSAISDVVFTGSNQTATNKAEAMIDTNAATWFEIESYFVPAIQPLKQQGKSYVYDNLSDKMAVFGEINSATLDQGWERSITWPGETAAVKKWIVTPYAGVAKPGSENALTLTVVFTFDSPVALSWMELIPMLEKMSTCSLTSVQVSPDGSTGWKELLAPPGLVLNTALSQPGDSLPETVRIKDHKGTAVIPCSVDKVKSVRVQLIQNTPYETLIAHSYQTADATLSIAETQWVKRSKKGWAGWTGSHYWQQQDTKTTETNATIRLTDTTAEKMSSRNYVDAGAVKTETVTSVKALENISTFYDIFKAYRYSAAIRDIDFKARSYTQSSMVVFNPIRFKQKVDAVSLYAAQVVPDNWPTGEYVTYEVSPDNATFTKIQPNNYTGTPAKAVIFDTPVDTVYLRITLTRPANAPNDSPVIDYVALSGAVHTEARI